MNLLVIFLFKKLVAKELHGTNNEELSTSWTDIECSHRSVGWETDWTTGEKRLTWSSHVDSCSIRIDKLYSSILISLCHIVFRVSILTRVLSWLILILFLFITLSSLGELVIETSVANKSLFGMQILMESLSDNRVTIDKNSYLLKHCIDVGVCLLLSALRHYYHTPTSFFDVPPNILYLLRIKWQSRTSQQK